MNASDARQAGLMLGLALQIVAGATAQSLPPVPVPAGNPVTEAKRVLGKILFWDAQLSSDGTTACGSCHRPSFAGADARTALHPGSDGVIGTPDDVVGSPGVIAASAEGIYLDDALFGLRPQVTSRSANVALVAAYAPLLFWDGRATGTFVDPESGAIALPAGAALESQAVGPVLSSVEMAHANRDWTEVSERLETARPLALAANRPADVAAAIARHGSYPALFAAAFGDPAIGAARIAMAIATYERTLVPDQTPWDAFVGGSPTALTPLQQQGLQTFNSPPARCAICHQPPFFTDFSFRNIGLRPWQEDEGRREVTGLFGDRGRFKVPTLRNVGLKGTFMHTGRLASLDQVVDFYRGVNGQVQFPENQDPLVPPIAIPPNLVAGLVAFLQGGLTDPRVASESFPFDRPTLMDELEPNPLLVGAAVPGQGGIAPRLVAVTPPMLGNASFRIGLDRARGGASATLEVYRVDPAAPGATAAFELGPITTSPGAAGEGQGTILMPLTEDLRRLGDRAWLRWRIEDDAAAGGVARTRSARVQFFLDDPTQCADACSGDLDCDGSVGYGDLTALLARWGGSVMLDAADLDDDGTVGLADLIGLLAGWGGCR